MAAINIQVLVQDLKLDTDQTKTVEPKEKYFCYYKTLPYFNQHNYQLMKCQHYYSQLKSSTSAHAQIPPYCTREQLCINWHSNINSIFGIVTQKKFSRPNRSRFNPSWYKNKRKGLIDRELH